MEKRGADGKAQPSAANMKKLSWDDELSTVAQVYIIYKIVANIITNKVNHLYHCSIHEVMHIKFIAGQTNVLDLLEYGMTKIVEPISFLLLVKIMLQNITQQNLVTSFFHQ